ncbi:MAG TPA: hypothetical protein VGA37_16545 [Gemmatimonadales bacterium]
MTDDLKRARGYRDLLSGAESTGPYEYAGIFPTETWRQRRLAKRKFKLLRRIDGALRAMLAEGERAFFLTRGSLISFWESYFMGWALYYVARRAIVVTNRRILLLQIDRRGRPRAVRAQIAFGAVEKLTLSWLGNVTIRFRDGTSRVVAYVPKPDRVYLRDLVERLARSVPATTGSIEDLCPHCFATADRDAAACPACGGPFKSASHAAWLSFVFPGAGDLYLGHRGSAAFELFFAVILWLGVVLVAWDPALGAAEFGLGLVVVVLMHLGDAVATRAVARRGIHPAAAPGGTVRRFLLAGVIPAAFLVSSLSPLAAKRGLSPADTVVTGAAMPDRHLAAIRRAGYVEEGEEILLFYSAGASSILEDGNLLTDRRVAAYTVEQGQSFYQATPFGNIIDLQLQPWPPSPGLSALVVVPGAGDAFLLLLPVAGAQHEAFVDEVDQRWRAAREAIDEGVWYDGGPGITIDQAIVIRGLAPDEEPLAAELRWLMIWFGRERTDWSMGSPERMTPDDRLIDRFVITTQGESQTLYFDVTGHR